MENDGHTNSMNEPLLKDVLKESSWNSRRIVILFSLCIALMLSCGTASLLAPFLPTEAQDRGVPISVVGIIFGSFSFTACLFSPISGSLIPKYGAYRILIGGLVLCSASLFLFGICKLLPSASLFVSFAIVLRIVSAIGAAACETSVMSIALGEFPHNLGIVTGVIETFAGVGFAVGPALGGFLYTAGGFQLPFFVFGSVMAAVVPIFLALCKKQESESVDKEEEKKLSMLQALKIPGVFVIAMCYVTHGTSSGLKAPILAPYLTPMGLNASQIGLMFLLTSLCFAFLTPVMGWIADKTHCYRCMIVLGITGVGIAYLLLGPAPFLSFILPTREVWLVCVAMALNGTFVGVSFVALMPELKNIARNNGMADNASTNGIISGIFSCMINLGVTIGPILGGVLNQHIGFQWTTTIEGFICISQALIVVAFIAIEKLVKRRKSTEDIKEEKGQLLKVSQAEN